MRTTKYSAVAAFFRREVTKIADKRSLTAKARVARDQNDANKLAQLSAETGVSTRALSLFSKLDGRQEFTAEAANKDFGHLTRKEIA